MFWTEIKAYYFGGPKVTCSFVVPPHVRDPITPSVTVRVFQLRTWLLRKPKTLFFLYLFHFHGFLHQIKQNPLPKLPTFNRFPRACFYHHHACGSLFLFIFNNPLKKGSWHFLQLPILAEKWVLFSQLACLLLLLFLKCLLWIWVLI